MKPKKDCPSCLNIGCVVRHICYNCGWVEGDDEWPTVQELGADGLYRKRKPYQGKTKKDFAPNFNFVADSRMEEIKKRAL